MIADIVNKGSWKKDTLMCWEHWTPASLVAQTAQQVDEILLWNYLGCQLMGITELRPHIAIITNIYFQALLTIMDREMNMFMPK